MLMKLLNAITLSGKELPLALVVVVGTHPALAFSSINAARSSSIEVLVKLLKKKISHKSGRLKQWNRDFANSIFLFE